MNNLQTRHYKALEERRAQWPIRVLSMVLRPLPASWFDKLTMTAYLCHFSFHISQDLYLK
jgi:hypothetical protein